MNLSFKDLKEIPDSITEMKSLRVLALTENQIGNIPAQIEELTLLEELDLDENKISCLPDSIGNLKSLTHLNLSDNYIESLPDSIGNLKLSLYIEGNKLSKLLDGIKQTLKDAKNIEYYDAKVEDAVNILDIFKRLSYENYLVQKELKEEYSNFSLQIILTDIKKKYWITLKKGIIDYGEGGVTNPSCTISLVLEVFAGILVGELNTFEEHLAGNVIIKGELEGLNSLQGMVEYFEEL